MIDIVGQRFSRLVVIERVKGSRWKCICDCGKETVVIGVYLKQGRTKSCGCLQRDNGRKQIAKINKIADDRSKHELYHVWYLMIKRCYLSNMVGYHNYGGRGIKVCKLWKNDFWAFIEDMGSRPSKQHSIDRIDTNGDYEPSNCRWATIKEQSRNKRSNVLIPYNGTTICMKEFCEVMGFNYRAFMWHRQQGKTVEEIVDFYKQKQSSSLSH